MLSLDARFRFMFFLSWAVTVISSYLGEDDFVTPVLSKAADRSLALQSSNHWNRTVANEAKRASRLDHIFSLDFPDA